MKRKFRISILLIFTLLVISSCNRRFDSDKWQKGYDHEIERKYPNKRKKMLKDLLRSHEIIGYDYEKLTDLLGEPPVKISNNDSLFLTYPCGRGSVPWYDGHVRKKILHITLTEDTVRLIKIEDVFFD